jgi:hypothetical protein
MLLITSLLNWNTCKVESSRANEGLISQDERVEYEAIINAADLITVLKLPGII